MEALKSHERIHRNCRSNDEEEHVKTFFNPAMEKFAPHLMKSVPFSFEESSLSKTPFSRATNQLT